MTAPATTRLLGWGPSEYHDGTSDFRTAGMGLFAFMTARATIRLLGWIRPRLTTVRVTTRLLGCGPSALVMTLAVLPAPRLASCSRAPAQCLLSHGTFGLALSLAWMGMTMATRSRIQILATRIYDTTSKRSSEHRIGVVLFNSSCGRFR